MASSKSSLPARSESPFQSREKVLSVSLVLLLLLAAFTAFFSRMYKIHVHVLADEWFAKGQASYQSGDYQEAVADLRNALSFSPTNPKFQLRFAKALSAAGRGEEARAYFQTLLSETPGSGEINLELARIAVRQGQMSDAAMYFHGAIYGEWSNDAIAQRWQVRREFCEFLIRRGVLHDVEGELIALADNTPPNDVERLKTVGNLLLRAQLWERALSVYQYVLILDTQNPDALSGAGRAAFQLGDYSQALEYFSQLPAEKKSKPEIAGMFNSSRLVVNVDPFREGLSAGEKVKRAANDMAAAQTRLNDCAASLGGWNSLPGEAVNLQKLNAAAQSMKMEWSGANLQKHPDRIEALMAWVFEVENETVQDCGAARDENDALWHLRGTRGSPGK